MIKRENFRQITQLDAVITQWDIVLRTLHGKKIHSQRISPAQAIGEHELSAEEKRHSAGLMRVNHTGEVCAQALYQGQALTAHLPDIRQQLQQAAAEEEDHLAWCQQRLNELDSNPSHLNPLWYALSFGIGAVAGSISDKLSLGFVAATEEQVCKHLDHHLAVLPANDQKSKAIIEQMRSDEDEHATFALDAGGTRFAKPVKTLMSQVAKVMTWASYRL